jgi:hypothetical protein
MWQQSDVTVDHVVVNDEHDFAAEFLRVDGSAGSGQLLLVHAIAERKYVGYAGQHHRR